MDLSLIQPKWYAATHTFKFRFYGLTNGSGVGRIPENVRFVISDFESQWTLGKDSFDLIHLRVGIGSVSSWPSLFRKAFE